MAVHSWQWSLDVWMADRDRQTDRQTDSQRETDRQTDRPTQKRPRMTQNQHKIDPKSTPHRPTIDPQSRKLASCARKRSKKRPKTIPSMVALVFLRFGPILGRSWAPLDFDLGLNIVQKTSPSGLVRPLGVSKSPFCPFLS